MRVLMYGWEFPPKNQGGLGVACEGIVKGLLNHGINVHLVLPTAEGVSTQGFSVTDISNSSKKISIKSSLKAYLDTAQYLEYISTLKNKQYGRNIFEEVERYKTAAGSLAKEIEHDIIHAHDWLTYPAAMEAKRISGKPFVAHIHATEIDRSGENPHPAIFAIEKLAFEMADRIIAVSEYTKRKIVQHYKIPGNKISVVHNAVTKEFKKIQTEQFSPDKKKVLFLGRITMQKGPEYFLYAAKKVLELEPETLFIMAGDGDMMGRMIHLAIELGIHQNVLFTGFLRGTDIDRAFQSANLFVIPSVSEPFGIVALESIKNGTPVLISKQSGASEVIPNMLRVDFWDIDEMANKIIAALRYEPMTDDLKYLSGRDLEKLSWEKQGEKIKDIYNEMT
jgi:glycosyltransferase involved in cell wall biosynthesis